MQLLIQANSKYLYHRLSPYSGNGIAINNYIYIDEKGKGLNSIVRRDSRTLPIGSSLVDVKRVSNVMFSKRGGSFLAKQMQLSAQNAFNETRMFNPTSPIVAAGMGASFGLTGRPQRNFDTSAGLGGMLGSMVGGLIGKLLDSGKVNPPDGTIGWSLPRSMQNIGGKGLLRASTANSGRAHFDKVWVGAKKPGFGQMLGALVTSMFPVLNIFSSQRQRGILMRSDEESYATMIRSDSTRFEYEGSLESGHTISQRWIAGGDGIYMNVKKSRNDDREQIFIPKANGSGYYKQRTGSSLKRGWGRIGASRYNEQQKNVQGEYGIRYGNSYGVDKYGDESDYKGSDIVVAWDYYENPNNEYPSKQSNTKAVERITSEFNRIIENIRKASNGLYKIDVPNESGIFNTGKMTLEKGVELDQWGTPKSTANKTKLNGYDRVMININKDKKRGDDPRNYPLSSLRDYRNAKAKDLRLLDNTIAPTENSSYRFSTNGQNDYINLLEVLDKDKKFNDNVKEWEPYKDDLIAFFFYDVVNERYIPFRATVNGISENGVASWEELAFIGRADKVYSYGGFNRSLSFNFKVVISSIAELFPTWKRINYLTTLIKPARYTSKTEGDSYDRFLIPPMVMLNIGDMYRDQPILIQSIGLTIPEDAAWETFNEDNRRDGWSGWSYLCNYIKAPKALYGQLPREVDINMTVVLLEKERPIVGGANFGHYPRVNDWYDFNESTVPNPGKRNTLHENLVVSN